MVADRLVDPLIFPRNVISRPTGKYESMVRVGSGGCGPEAVPKQTSRPRRFRESIEPAKVSLPTLS